MNCQSQISHVVLAVLLEAHDWDEAWTKLLFIFGRRALRITGLYAEKIARISDSIRI